MVISLLITNELPDLDGNVELPLLNLFRDYAGQDLLPFRHQAETFRLIMDDKEVFLVAGTAAGKTLAIAVPLFHKLKEGRIQKVLLMYPTIALMEDQRRVMDRLATLTGLEVSQIQGGMSRSQLIASLTKPVILATPDAIYWFFRKNVKYSGLLIYALALVDDFVLDEAHLFNGLMLRNFEHLWRRIQSLAQILGRSPRLHILTATPTETLQRLNNGISITGRSKCQDVRVEFRICERFDRSEAMAATINETLAAGRNKVLVVSNSARTAHQLFEKHKVNADVDLPVAHRLRFGRVKFHELLQWLEQCGIESEVLDELSVRFSGQEDITLADLPSGTKVTLPLADVIAGVTDVLEHQCGRVKRALWEKKQQLGETWESLLGNSPLPCAIVSALQSQLQNAPDLERQQALVDQWLADTLDRLGAVAEEQIPCQAPDFCGLMQTLASAMDKPLAELVVKRLVHEIKVNPEWADGLPRGLSQRPIYLRWLDWMVDEGRVERVRTLVQQGLESGTLKVDCRHIGLWKGTNVPVIIYSGSMARYARAGLIDVFADLERAVLISTSAVEVGVDFAADVLITEECEGNSFLQRFGRVGRHGNDSRVLAFVSGDVASQWHDLNEQRLSREEFSVRIRETFPQRNYSAASALVDAGHYLVNEQLGRIGTRLNLAPEMVAVQPLAQQLRAAEIPVGFGLRSTMPQITLRDGVTKDPFYILRYVEDEDLRPADSPFEIARAKVWFTTLIFQRARFNVMVDLNRSLVASRAWFIIKDGALQKIEVQPGIGAKYVRGMIEYFKQRSDWNPWLLGNFLLLYGDVYLQRTEAQYSNSEPVCDDEQNPLFIPAQNYLVFIGWGDADKAREQIAQSPIADWEEIYYDWDGIPYNKALVLLEQTAGACFAAYKEWLDYVGRRIQK